MKRQHALVARHKGKKVPAAVKPFTTWAEADLNDDGVINVLDLTAAIRELNDVQSWVKMRDVEAIEEQGNGQGAVITVSEADFNKDGIIDYVDGLAIFAKLVNVTHWHGKEDPNATP